ncbi:hypothetical protein [Microbacterium timonense]|uniref:hypothetical protein n=1 Tax=Microbacterium timonense TaxID=2086576 RepID=UPI000D0FB668|nr:hypothetical protein [Microbacterium timonense]
MHRRVLALVAAALLLSGCAATDPTPAHTSAPPSRTAETPTAAPTPTTASAIVLGLDSLEITQAGATRVVRFDTPDPLLVLVEELTGVPRNGEVVEDPWGNGDMWGTTYRWDEITITVPIDGPANVAILAATLGGIPVRTTEGIGVGDSRDEVLAAGGWEHWDADGDGVSDYLGIDSRDAPDTQSLTRPGEVGRMFILAGLDGDIVSELQSPSNDFSDI